eukprot:3886742-Pleurochrysis_carterae.AAC.1
MALDIKAAKGVRQIWEGRVAHHTPRVWAGIHRLDEGLQCASAKRRSIETPSDARGSMRVLVRACTSEHEADAVARAARRPNSLMHARGASRVRHSSQCRWGVRDELVFGGGRAPEVLRASNAWWLVRGEDDPDRERMVGAGA